MQQRIRKWYFALNSDAPAYYKEMAQVALISAYLHADLQPVLLYDGEKDELTDWMEKLGVVVVHVQSRFIDRFDNVKRAAVGGEFSRVFASGAYLRFEIPDVEQDDEYVLYTDVDVVFLNNPNPFPVAPRLFACAPEIFIQDYTHLNSGVMIMNIENFKRELPRIEDFVLEHICEAGCYDQWVLNQMYPIEWERLPPEYNWKPYWGINPEAYILHFHGPKPKDVVRLIEAPHDPTDQFSRLMYRSKSAYYQYNLLYEEIVKHIDKAVEVADKHDEV